MQTKKGAQAKAPTEEEVEDWMDAVMREWARRQAGEPAPVQPDDSGDESEYSTEGSDGEEELGSESETEADSEEYSVADGASNRYELSSGQLTDMSFMGEVVVSGSDDDEEAQADSSAATAAVVEGGSAGGAAEGSPVAAPLLCAPLLSMDNVRTHCPGSEKWSKHLLFSKDLWPYGTLLPLAPKSGDMHNVVELAHARIKRRMQAYIDSKPADWPLRKYIDKLKRVFYTLITPEWVQKTTHRLLIKTLPAVLRAQGAYPAKCVR
jgi:hypothetical protein